MGDIQPDGIDLSGQPRPPNPPEDAPQSHAKSPPPPRLSGQAATVPMTVSSTPQGAPFYSQYNSVHQLQPRLDIARGSGQQPSINASAVSPGSEQGSSPFVMGGMAAALPEYSQIPPPQQQVPRTLSGASTPALVYQLQQNLHYSGHQAPQYAPQAFAPMPFPPGQQYPPAYMPAQAIPPGSYPMLPANQQRASGGSPAYPNFQQQAHQYMYYPAPYGPQTHTIQQYALQPPQHLGSHGRRSSGPSGQTPILSPSGDPIALGGNPSFGRPAYSVNGLPGDANSAGGIHGSVAGTAVQRASFDTSAGSIPRGPPRKPKQSGHALWVGNLPPGTTISDLKDHFSREATRDIESLFFIAKSNCAFVNYRTEAACTAAMHRFHDSRFHGVRLVCRLRRSSGATAGIPTGPSAMTAPRPPSPSPQPSPPSGEVEQGKEALEQPNEAEDVKEAGPRQGRVAEKFFIVKSLTLQDLELSARNGIWATQSHNEEALNTAYQTADNVYLIFSANKSGEYFGYARMSSPIMEDATEIMRTLPQTTVVDASDAPKSIPTAATEFAPKGRIIDDSARGTIFWEADLSDLEEESRPVEDGPAVDGELPAAPQTFGKPFRVEWISTNRLPFYRTRGLRNSWNANREVKIARDGTELETNVGRRLIQMFHRLGPSTASPAGPPAVPLQQPTMGGGPPSGPY